ncbi:MAG TPA: 4-alpha-glucanotransferase [Pyrinomonadaceae bacterium]|nr:4-alpha-glucanotransferase [Pyrinomonadaceae bacterium]
MGFPRTCGILLHPTSLPGRFGVGDLGPEAYRFVDFLAAAGQHLWQVLPLGPTGYGDSPYQCFSAFAGNALLVSPEALEGDGLLSGEDLSGAPDFPEGRVDYGGANRLKGTLLARAFENFRAGAGGDALRAEFDSFRAEHASWLDDYALYRALKSERQERAWTEWEEELVRREAGALEAARARLSNEVEAVGFQQFLFFRQWSALKAYANERDISVIGDIPIFVAHDSADVWARPRLFKLDELGRARVVAGVPPDYFSRTGQLWGNPLYDWDRMREDGFRWWVERARALLRMVDIVRIDHFRGFAAYWEIPGGDETAERGRWAEAPGRELFEAIGRALGVLPIIAEDLGFITPDVIELRDRFDFPGMRILQFGFSTDSTNKDLPHNYVRNSVVYTGTHDNDTAVGWFTSDPGGAASVRSAAQVEREKQFCLAYLDTGGSEINWDFIRAAYGSAADTALVPLQDVLGLGSGARMNTPATTSGNWAWRFRDGDLSDETGARLRRLAELYGRHPVMRPEDRPEHTAESYEAEQKWG